MITSLWPNNSHADLDSTDYLTIVESHGAWLQSTSSMRYLDCRLESSAATLTPGHPDTPDYQAVLTGQLQELEYSTLFRASHKPAQTLANMLVAMFGKNHPHVFLSSSAAEAVETALKMVRQFHVLGGNFERTIVVSVQGSHHGHLSGTSSASGLSDLDTDRSLLHPHFLSIDGSPDKVAENISRLVDSIGPHRMGCFLVQPFRPWSEDQAYSQNLIENLHSLVNGYGALFVLDQCLTGLGRLDSGSTTTTLVNTDCDILCLGAALGNGVMPLAASMASRHVFDRFLSDDGHSNFTHGCTNSGHPVASAVGVATLASLDGMISQSGYTARRELLCAGLHQIAHDFKLIIRGSGFLWCLGITQKALVNLDGVQRTLQADGILVSRLDSGLCICPPLTISETDINFLLQHLAKAFAQSSPVTVDQPGETNSQ